MYTDTDRFRDISSAFIDGGYIVDSGRVIKRGKEATVLCCPAHPSLGVQYVALKIYRDQEFRNFRNDAEYLAGKVWKRRDLAHLKAFKDDLWVETEFRVLSDLSAAGVRVPRPYTQIDHAVIMEHIGTDGVDAAILKKCRLTPDEAPRVRAEILETVEGMLACGIIHGDLSAFNILYDGVHPVVIDFPQAVRVSTNRNSYRLFLRDIENVCVFFEQYATVPRVDSVEEFATEIWTRHVGSTR